MTALLEVDRLSVRYNKLIALSDVSLTVHAGAVTSVIGPNGAGKTSLVNAIMGVIPSTGKIRFPAWPSAVRSIEARVRAHIALVPETRELFGPMTVLDNLRLGAFAQRRDPSLNVNQRLSDVFDLFPRLAERRSQYAQTLSGGERQMLALGRSLMMRPRLLMLDEPSLGLAPLVIADIFAVIQRLKREGVSILLIEQNARAALKISDDAYVLENGIVQLHGRAADMASNPRVIEGYLGLLTVASPERCGNAA